MENIIHSAHKHSWVALERYMQNLDITSVYITNVFTISDYHINSLAPGRFEWNFKQVIFKLILVIDDLDISYEITLRQFSLDLTDDINMTCQIKVAFEPLILTWPELKLNFNDADVRHTMISLRKVTYIYQKMLR